MPALAVCAITAAQARTAVHARTAVCAGTAVCARTAVHARTAVCGRATGGTILAAAYPGDDPPADPGMLPLAVPDVKRLVNLFTSSWRGLRYRLQ
jgi:hypothetical protein